MLAQMRYLWQHKGCLEEKIMARKPYAIRLGKNPYNEVASFIEDLKREGVVAIADAVQRCESNGKYWHCVANGNDLVVSYNLGDQSWEVTVPWF